MKTKSVFAILCGLLLVGISVLTIGCAGSGIMSRRSDVSEVEKYVQEQLAFVTPCAPAFPARRYVPVQVLAINDFHGQLTAGKKVSGRPVGSAPVLASYIESASEGMEDRTFIVSAGDLVGASIPESALLQDEPTVMFLNMLGNSFASPERQMHPLNNLVAVPGNHEFDEGKQELLRLIDGGNHEEGPFLQDPYEGAFSPFVCANVTLTDSGRYFLPPLVIKNVRGVRIAFIGAVLTETPTIVNPSGVAGLTFLDEAESINTCVSVLKRHGVRAIIAIIHQGTTQSSYSGPTDPASSPPKPGPIVNIVNALDGEVDVVISAHSHGFTNAIVPSRDGTGVLVTQAWSAGTAYADIDLEIDRRLRDVVSVSARIVTTWADTGPGLSPDPGVAALVAAAEAAVAPLTDRVMGTAVSDVTRSQNKAGESALGNLIADAQRAALVSDFALMNSGGIRADITAGEVTWGELYTVQPFNNYLVRVELTGQQIYDVLNQQWAGQPYPRILQVSGLSYTWDGSLPDSSRVVEVRREGVPIDKTAVYTVTANNFIADGGDNFTVLRDFGSNRVAGPVDLNALVGYIESMGRPFTASIEGRIVRLD